MGDHNVIDMAKGYVIFMSLPYVSTLEVASKIGVVSRLERVRSVQSLSPRNTYESTWNTYSGNYGLNRFPLHSDLAHWQCPPRYILLRCIIPDPRVQTEILDLNSFLSHESNDVLSRAHFRPRRMLEGKMFLLRLLNKEVSRWDPILIEPANSLAGKLRSRVIEYIKSANSDALTLSTPGECIIIDNWKMIHGRSQVSSKNSNRKIERIYLEAIHP